MAQTADQTLRTLRIACLGTVAGIILFPVVMITLNGEFASSEWSERTPLLLNVLAVLVFGCLTAYVVVERIAVARVARGRLQGQYDEESGATLEAYRQLTILQAGLIDGPSFLGGIIYLLTGNGLGLVAAGVGVSLLLSRMPSRERFERFVQRTRQPS
jgi:hypothetical protein